MSNKRDALKLLAAGGTPTTVDVFNALNNCETASAAVVLMSTLKHNGLVEPAGKTEGEGRPLTQWRITAAGRETLEQLELKASGTGATATRKKAAGRSGKPARRVKKAKPVKPRKYKKRKVKKTAITHSVKAAVPPSRWAVTEDGAFLDLAAPGSDEISGTRARSLVAFIRKLDVEQRA